MSLKGVTFFFTSSILAQVQFKNQKTKNGLSLTAIPEGKHHQLAASQQIHWLIRQCLATQCTNLEPGACTKQEEVSNAAHSSNFPLTTDIGKDTVMISRERIEQLKTVAFTKFF